MEEIKKEPVTVLLILINTLIFLVVEFTGGSENGQHMLECGAAYAPLILEQGQWYRLFSSMFLHFGAPHLINNMLVLFVLGQRLEPVTGKIKFFFFGLVIVAVLRQHCCRCGVRVKKIPCRAPLRNAK